jgi:hypothetical protein
MTYLERLRALKYQKGATCQTAKSAKTYTDGTQSHEPTSVDIDFVSFGSASGTPFSEKTHPLQRTLSALETRCPGLVPADRWELAVEDGRHFLAGWGEQAEALGWTARDLFGLHTSPAKPHPSYTRLSRYDETGLIWLLQGRPVVALTETTAAIQNPSGAITTYRRHNKPALGPPGTICNDR